MQLNKVLLHLALRSFLPGALLVLAFAPFEFYWLAFPLLAIVFHAWEKLSLRYAFLHGFVFGLGLTLFGLFWLSVSIGQFGGVSTPLAILATVLFATVVAVFYGLTAFVSIWIKQRFQLPREVVILWLLPAVWTLFEILRSVIFTGFPWLSLGYTQTAYLTGSVATVGGVFLVSWLVALLASLLVLISTSGRQLRILSLTITTIVVLVSGLLQQLDWTEVNGEPIRVAIVQGNIEQAEKWQPDQLVPTIRLYEQLSFTVPSDLVVWPETAIPAFLHQVEDSVFKPLELKLQKFNRQLVTGIPIWNDEKRVYYNSMISLGSRSDRYDKRHLVPFGEFMPLDQWLRPVLDWLKIPLSDFRGGTAARPLLQVGDYQAGVSICYEDAFGRESIQALPDADYLLNISNDAWFGDSLAPHQHLQMARMRAVESQRYMVRATNTGISAIIDQRGVIKTRSPQYKTAVTDGDLQPLKGATPYTFWGDWLVLLLMPTLIVAAILSVRWRAKD